MRSSRRSTISRALVAVALLLPATTAGAQNAPPPTAPGARARIQSEGDAAMERVKQALGKARRTPVDSPGLPAAPDATVQRRAFDGLARRAIDPDMEKRARSDIEAARAALAKERSAASAWIAQALGLEAPEASALAAPPAPVTRSRVPLLMVSSAMPIATLRTYAAGLERVRGIMVFRGMPGGMTRVAPMAKLSAEILRIDPGCEGPACAMRDVQIIVDPLVFRQHGVTRVPALAMVPGDPVQPYCERDDQSPPSAHAIFGDAALSALFEEFARLGGKEDVRDALARLAPR